MRGRKDIRAVQQFKRSFCPECSFSGNFTQVKLHLKVTHKNNSVVERNRAGEVCYLCKGYFLTKKQVKKHMLAMHSL